MKRVSIVICSQKGGHKFPAESLVSYLESRYPGKIKVGIVNLLDHIPLAYHCDKLTRWGDLKLRRLWKSGYANLHKGNPSFTQWYRKLTAIVLGNKDSQRRIKGALNRPDLIISFQPEVNCIAGWLRKQFNVPIHTMVMDYSAHIGWTDKSIGQYYVSNEIVHDQLINYGVPQEKILITGAPPQKGFEEVTQNSIEQQRQHLGIKKDWFTILIMSGFLGKMVDYFGIIQTLLKIKKPIQLLVVSGKNRVVYERIKKKNWKNVYPYFNIPNIHTVMWAADLIISKPGGMVIADSLALGKPMILINPVGGSLQEIIFAQHIANQGVGIHLKDADEVQGVVEDLLSHPDKIKRVARKSYELGTKNRNAARTIAHDIEKTIAIRG